MPIWDETLATGVTGIDDQHKELFSRINNLLSACKQGKGMEEVTRTMRFLADYVIDHFATEEGYMATYNYPDSSYHKSQHEEFVEGFSELKKDFEAKGSSFSIVISTNRLLGVWWINHISKVDMALGAFLKTKGGL